eukprot:SAG25_NODE_4584_length_787_cov_1.281977_2_plen_48_part_00
MVKSMREWAVTLGLMKDDIGKLPTYVTDVQEDMAEVKAKLDQLLARP